MESIRQQIESGSTPSSWTIFRRSAKSASGRAVGFMVLGLFSALVGVWLMTEPSYGFAGLIFVVFGVYLAGWRGLKRLKGVGFGAVVLTDQELVVLDGKNEQRFPYANITEHVLRVDSGMANQPVPELYVALGQEGKRVRVVRGNEFGAPEAIRNALSAKLRS